MLAPYVLQHDIAPSQVLSVLKLKNQDSYSRLPLARPAGAGAGGDAGEIHREASDD